MKRAVVHIGMEGTGTSSIQRVLARDAEHLAAQGVQVLGTGRPSPDVAKTRIEWRRERDASWDQLADELDALRDVDTIVLSNEMLWLQPPQALYRLGGMLADRSVTILLYLREQADFLQWRVLQDQKKLEKSFDFRDREEFKRVAGRRKLDYFEVCRRFETVFGRGSVDARVFDRALLVGNDVVADVYDLLGVASPDGSAWPTANPSLSADLAEVLRVRRDVLRSEFPLPDLVDVAVRLSRQGVGRRHFLTEPQVARIQSGYEQSNRRVARRFLTNADEIPHRQVWADPTSPDLDELQGVLLAAAREAPKLGKGWAGGPGIASKLFTHGWKLEKGHDGSSVRARIENGHGDLRFRTSYQRETRVGVGGLHLRIHTEDRRPLDVEVAVDGHALGPHTFPADPVVLGSALPSGIATEVSLSARQDGPHPAVVEIELVDADRDQP